MSLFGFGSNGQKEQDNYKAVPIPARLKKHQRIAILTDNKAEDLEFFYPYYRFNEAGYDVDVITCDGGAFEGKKGIGLKESKSISEVKPENYVLLYLPGGKAPEKLRESTRVLAFVRHFAESGKPIAAICHGAQILVSAGLVKGKKVAAWPEVECEIKEAGGSFADEALQIDGQFITARRPGDLHRHLSGVMEALEKIKGNGSSKKVATKKTSTSKVSDSKKPVVKKVSSSAKNVSKSVSAVKKTVAKAAPKSTAKKPTPKKK